MLVISSMLLTGCVGNQEKQTTVIKERNIFEHEQFSIVLPAPYTVDANSIHPKKENAFLPIVFGSSKEEIETTKLLEFTEEWFKNLCDQTDVCGKIISSETKIIDANNALKFTVQYQGRSLEDRNGYLNEYHYSILKGGNLLQFWTSASDLENPEKISKSFDDIIETILFK